MFLNSFLIYMSVRYFGCGLGPLSGINLLVFVEDARELLIKYIRL